MPIFFSTTPPTITQTRTTVIRGQFEFNSATVPKLVLVVVFYLRICMYNIIAIVK